MLTKELFTEFFCYTTFMETPKRALTPRIETAWMNDPVVPLAEHIDKVASFDYTTMDPGLISRHKAHEANIKQKEKRLHSIHSNRRAVIARRALIDTIET